MLPQLWEPDLRRFRSLGLSVAHPLPKKDRICCSRIFIWERWGSSSLG
jgi:hypothetical protein